ncbi:MAG: substrate-binding domain-containing protein [Cellulosilyticaceae bacterium]
MKKLGEVLKILAIIGVIIGIVGVLYWVSKGNKKPDKIVFISKSTQSEYVFWDTVRMGAELAAREENIELEYTGPLEEKDIAVQMNILEGKIEEGVDVILLAATDSNKLKGLVERAREEGITVVSVDSAVEGQDRIVATNNVEASSVLTRHLARLIGGQGEVIMLNFVQETSTAKEREEGYDLEIDRHPGISKLPTVYTEGTTESAYEEAKELLTRYPDLKGIVSGNQYTTEGVCLAVEELGLAGKVKVVGFDSSTVIVEGLEKGVVNAIIVQKPFNMGYIGVKTAIDLFANKKIDDHIDTGYKLITPDVLYLTENQKLLYPIIE